MIDIRPVIRCPATTEYPDPAFHLPDNPVSGIRPKIHIWPNPINYVICLNKSEISREDQRMVVRNLHNHTLFDCCVGHSSLHWQPKLSPQHIQFKYIWMLWSYLGEMSFSSTSSQNLSLDYQITHVQVLMWNKFVVAVMVRVQLELI